MEPAMPMVLAQSLLAPRLPVSLWALSLATPCTSSLHRETQQHTSVYCRHHTALQDTPQSTSSVYTRLC